TNNYSTHSQPAGAEVVETCTWQLAPAAASSNLPPPPPSSTSSTGTIAPTTGNAPASLTIAKPAGASTPGATPADGPWSGQAECVLTVRADNYIDEQTHTWRITGGPPTLNGIFR